MAVLLVVAFHVGAPLRGGFVGVDVFFVLSGFVITRLLVAELIATGRVDFARFYGRRVRRLLPALAFMLVTVALASVALGSYGSQNLTGWTAVGAALTFANVVLYRQGDGYFDDASDSNPLLHTWSLSLEEQFYVFFPALLAFGWWLGRRRPRAQRNLAQALVLVTCAVSFGLCLVMTAGSGQGAVSDPRSFAFYSPLTRAWEFGIGAITFFACAERNPSDRARRACSIMGCLLLGWASIAYSPTTAFPGAAALAPTIGTALLIVAGSGGAAVGVTRVLQAPVLVWIGDVSYSWYLWHWPFIVLSRALFPPTIWLASGMAALSLLAAWGSIVAVEAPFRSWGGSPRRTAVLTLVCVSLSLMGGAALVALSRALLAIPRIAHFNLATRLHMDVTAGCSSGSPLGSRPDCVRSPAPSLGRILVVGDSNAGQFSEPIIVAGLSLGRSVEIATKAACPFADVVLWRAGIQQVQCREFFEASMAAMVAQPPALVIIASASDLYIDSAEWTLAKPGSSEGETTPEGKARVWEEQSLSPLRSLRDAGSRVLVIYPIPKLGTWKARSCAAALIALWPEACGISRPLDEALLSRRRALDAERPSADAAGIYTLDLASRICPGSRCQAVRDGVWWYRDGEHLGVEGALALTPDFHDALSRALGPRENRANPEDR